SPTGSCLQLFIQLPILWALWQVIYKIPAYVDSVRAVFTAVVDKIVEVPEYTTILNNFITENTMTRVRLILENEVATKDSVIDFLYALSPNQWKIFSALPEVSEFSGTIDTAAANISKMQNFFGLNIAEQPLYYIKNVVTGGSIVLCIVAILIPVLSWLTQMLNIKLMPQMTSDDDKSAAGSSMKTMNTFMPLMSAFFCLSFPVGLGIYWIASAVVRSIQQVVINKKLDSEDINDIIEANLKKAEKKREKAGLPPQKITNQAHQSVKNIGSGSSDRQERMEKVNQAYENARKASPGSIAAKANMVRDYNERNKK
ncbi:MAG: YidC/Oxa1 family membrane protein insertase, partial [Blautia sp.]|nr:YidC/Oxa1 family membrane protein insertase [Blautia sp.]